MRQRACKVALQACLLRRAAMSTCRDAGIHPDHSQIFRVCRACNSHQHARKSSPAPQVVDNLLKRGPVVSYLRPAALDQRYVGRQLRGGGEGGLDAPHEVRSTHEGRHYSGPRHTPAQSTKPANVRRSPSCGQRAVTAENSHAAQRQHCLLQCRAAAVRGRPGAAWRGSRRS